MLEGQLLWSSLYQEEEESLTITIVVPSTKTPTYKTHTTHKKHRERNYDGYRGNVGYTANTQHESSDVSYHSLLVGWCLYLKAEVMRWQTANLAQES